jgi:hypothetical protein
LARRALVPAPLRFLPFSPPRRRVRSYPSPSGFQSAPQLLASRCLSFMVFENPRVPDSDSRASADHDFLTARGAAAGPGVMANSLPPNKAAGSGSSASAAAQPHLPVSQAETHSRRPGGSGAFGAGASTRPGAAGRNNQAMRKQHKQRRPKLAYDDAQIEAVSQIPHVAAAAVSLQMNHPANRLSSFTQAAIRSTSSRKGQTSITHLMNFTLPPRPQSQSHQWHGRPYRRNPTWGLGSGYHAIDKLRWVKQDGLRTLPCSQSAGTYMQTTAS